MSNKRAILGIALVILAVALWRVIQPAPSYHLLPTQLTFDPGLTGWPAISPDGRTVAYASDRDTGTNLELYVQPVRGGSPARLTTGSENNSEPAFSPDGATLAFAATGGIYIVPVAGGDPRLIAASGHRPRYSPDGRWIAYSDAAGAAIMGSNGGAPRRIDPELSSVRAPAWSPDGRSLIFWARGDLWVAPLDGRTPQPAGIGPRLAKAEIGSGPFEDGLWTSYGFVFSARTGVVRNLYRCPLGRDGKTNGDIVRLTNGTELMGEASVSRDGRIVFSSGRQRFDIWGLPLDASGKVKGAPYRITDTLAPTANPDISADGHKLIFGSSRNGFTEIWEKDLVSGKESVAATGPEGASYGKLLKSSGGILYARPTSVHEDVYIGNRILAVGTRPWDADSKETTILVSGAGIDALDVSTKQRVPLLNAPDRTKLSEASFSPDDRWVLFVAETLEASRIYVAPARGGAAWQPITGEDVKAGKPRFSPDGRMIYFTVDHESTREIDAILFDPHTGGVSGQAFPVFRPAAARLTLLEVNPQALEIAVARDKLVTILCERISTIWMGELVLQ